jgi:hypothetical protein
MTRADLREMGNVQCHFRFLTRTYSGKSHEDIHSFSVSELFLLRDNRRRADQHLILKVVGYPEPEEKVVPQSHETLLPTRRLLQNPASG